MTLRDLEPGDIFRHKKSKDKHPDKFVVYGSPEYNHGYGAATRMCRTMAGQWRGKSCRLEVVKMGESQHKAKLMEKYCNQNKTNAI